MAEKKKFDLNGWADVNQEAFTMSFSSKPIDWTQIVTKNKTIYIHIFPNQDDDVAYRFESAKPFTVRKVCGLINDAYLMYVDDYGDGDFDSVSNVAINGFYFTKPDQVHVYYST
jgi:hypothetical protein